MELNSAAAVVQPSRSSRVEDVVSTVSDWIIEQKIKPEEMLPAEARLAEHFGVSRTVIRESVRLLAERGLIEIVHGKRHRVRPPSGEIAASHLKRMLTRGFGTLNDLVELRLPLEVAIASHAAQRRTDVQLERAHACVTQQEQTEALEEQVKLDICFHELLGEMTSNPLFCLVLRAVAGPLAESRRRTIGSPGGNVKSVKGHRDIIKALEARDSAAAETAMHQHLSIASSMLRNMSAPRE